MKNIIILALLVSLSSFSFAHEKKYNGLNMPESVAEGVDGYIYVSEIGEKDKDGDGKIRKIDNKLVQSKCKWTPFHGMKIKGWPIGTMINGTKVFWNDKVLGKPSGKPLNFN
jgi:hypothetical protein